MAQDDAARCRCCGGPAHRTAMELRMCETQLWTTPRLFRIIPDAEPPAVIGPLKRWPGRPPASCWLLWDAVASAATLLLLLDNDPHAAIWQLLLPAFSHPVICPLEAP